MGGINIPPPQYMFVNRGDGTQTQDSQGQQPNVDSLVNDLLRSFMDIFTGHEFLRMRA